MREAAAILGATASVVNERIRDGTLLFIPMPSGDGLPRAQFAPDRGTLPGLDKVLKAMHVRVPWSRVQLFLDNDVRGALENGRVDDAVSAAASYLPDERDR